MDSNKRARDMESLDELLSVEFAANEVDLNAQLAEVRSKVGHDCSTALSHPDSYFLGRNRHRFRSADCREN